LSFSATSSDAKEIPQAPRGLVAIHVIAGVYGIGIGSILSLTGPFVGLHVLLAGIAHIAIGVGFITAAMGISKARRSAYISGSLLSAAVATIASVVTFSSVQKEDPTPAIVWGFIIAFFSAVAFVTWYSSRSVANPITQNRTH